MKKVVGKTESRRVAHTLYLKTHHEEAQFNKTYIHKNR